VQQFVEEDYLRWDSLGEFLALAASLEHLASTTTTPARRCWPMRWMPPTPSSWTTTTRPRRKVGTLDNRGSHFYLALYWAQALAAQTTTPSSKAKFAPLAKALAEAKRRSSPS
jgi:isocitrate dehydrogenase